MAVELALYLTIYSWHIVEDGCYRADYLEFAFLGNWRQSIPGGASIAAATYIRVQIHQATVAQPTTSAEGTMRSGHALAFWSLSNATGYGAKACYFI